MGLIKITVSGGSSALPYGASVIQATNTGGTPSDPAVAGIVWGYDGVNGFYWINTTAGTWLTGTYYIWDGTNYAGPISVVAEPSWLSGWTYRRAVLLDQSTAALTNFPTLVALTATVAVTDTEVMDNGYDLRFTDVDGTTALDFERENYSESGGKALGNFWVKVPSISTTYGAILFVYWGKADATDGSVAAAPWDASTVSVYHMNEGSGALVDSKSGLNGTGVGDVPDNARAGRVNLGQDLDGNGDYFTVADNAAHDPGAAMTAECWILCDAGVSSSALIMHDTSEYKWLIYGPLAAWTVMYYVRTASGVTNTGGAYLIPDTSNFHHIVGVYDKTLGSGRVALYADGDLKESANGYNENISAGDEGVTIGTWTKSAYECVNGVIDEVRYHNAARSAEWINYTYHNMADADNAQTWAGKETAGAPPAEGEVSPAARWMLAQRRRK